jgi:hypothetical protein
MDDTSTTGQLVDVNPQPVFELTYFGKNISNDGLQLLYLKSFSETKMISKSKRNSPARINVRDSAELKNKCICPDGSYGLFLISG